MKELLNVKNPKIYAEMFLSCMSRNAKRILRKRNLRFLMYSISDKRTIEIILDSFPKATFVIADREANLRLLRHFYKGKRFTYINITDDEDDLILFNEEGDIWKMPKFDFAIMNPPYDGELHLKILEKVIPVADKVVNISPSNCYTCNRLKFSTDIRGYDKFVKSIFSHCTSVDKISAVEASKMFKTAQGTDLAISVYDNTYTDENYVADKFLKYDNKNLEKSICDKILKKCKQSHWETYKGTGSYILNTSHVHGHVGCKDFTNLLCMTYDDALKVKKTPDKRSCQFRFRTKKERKNFYNAYMNSKVIHWWNYQWKNQIILVLKYIPYMSDYTQPWDDKRFCKYFGITGYISDTEAEPNSEWEFILNTMKEYM